MKKVNECVFANWIGENKWTYEKKNSWYKTTLGSIGKDGFPTTVIHRKTTDQLFEMFKKGDKKLIIERIQNIIRG